MRQIIYSLQNNQNVIDLPSGNGLKPSSHIFFSKHLLLCPPSVEQNQWDGMNKIYTRRGVLATSLDLCYKCVFVCFISIEESEAQSPLWSSEYSDGMKTARSAGCPG